MNTFFSVTCIIALAALTPAAGIRELKKEVVETIPPWAVASTAKTTALVQIGCYRDSPLGRALPVLIKNYRLERIDWSNMDLIVKGCARAARRLDYQWFSVQFYGECWAGKNARETYAKYGKSKNCWKGVGKSWTNMVYKIEY